MFDEAFDLRLGRATVALDPLADEAEHAQRDPCEVDRLRRVGEAMDRRAIRQQGADVAKVAAEGHPAGALSGSGFAELNRGFPVKIGQADPAQPTLEELHAVGLRTAGRLADALHVADVQIDQVAEGLDAFQLARDRLTAHVQVAFNAPGPGLCIFAMAEGLA